jgi:hypothetical protein
LQTYLDIQSASPKKRGSKGLDKQAAVAVQDAMHITIKNFK